MTLKGLIVAGLRFQLAAVRTGRCSVDDRAGPSGALHPYASRGETPMVWGGSGVRLVRCCRPGIELVVSPHKSVAELGVIGRAEDMHVIVDAERDATLAYLDRLVAERGGRRGRSQTVPRLAGCSG